MSNSKEHTSYKILRNSELNDLMEQIGVKDVIQLEHNKASVTTLMDNSYVLFPAHGDRGVLFYNQLELEEMIQNKTYPVNENPSFLEKEKTRILNLEHSIDYFMMELSESYKTEFKISQDKAYLDQLSKTIVERKRKPNEFEINALSIYFSALMKDKVNGVWKYRPIYAFNVFYEPEVCDKNGMKRSQAYVMAMKLLDSKYWRHGFDLGAMLERYTEDFNTIHGEQY